MKPSNYLYFNDLRDTFNFPPLISLNVCPHQVPMFHKPVTQCTFNICFQHGPAMSITKRNVFQKEGSDSVGADSHLPRQHHCSSCLWPFTGSSAALTKQFPSSISKSPGLPCSQLLLREAPQPPPHCPGSHVWDHRTVLPPLPSPLWLTQTVAESLTCGQLIHGTARDQDLYGLIKNINLTKNILLGI